VATNPDQLQQEAEQRRQREAEVAALALLLLSRKRYDLPALIASRKARIRPFRRISPSGVMAGDLARVYLRIVDAWRAEQPGLVAAYAASQGIAGRDGLIRAMEEASARTERAASIARRQMADEIERIERWHRAQWVSRVKSATGLDVALLTNASDVAPEVTTAAAWNEQLAGDVHAQTKARIITALLSGAAVAAPATRAAVKAQALEGPPSDPDEQPAETGADVGTPPSIEERIEDAVNKARRRAKNIGTDQVEKTSASLTRARRQSAGVTSWRWRHYDPQPNPRIEHIRRDGRIYSDNRPPPTQCGEEPYCKCWEEPIFR